MDFEGFAMIRYAIAPRFEVVFEGAPDSSFHSHTGMSKPGWYYRFTGLEPFEYVLPYARRASFDPRWRYSDTADRSETVAVARRAAKKRAMVYKGPANVRVRKWRETDGAVELFENWKDEGHPVAVRGWVLSIQGELRDVASQIERRKKWEVARPQKFELEILNRDEVAELVRSIAAEQER